MNETSYDPKSFNDAINSAIYSTLSSVSELNELIDQANPSFAVCFRYPSLSLEEERENRLSGNTAPRPICIEEVSDPFIAMTEIKRSFRDIYSHESSSSKSTFRLPGFIVIDNESLFKAISEAVQKVNHYKNVFAELIKIPDEDISPNFNKDQYFVEQHSHLVKLQVSRKIHCHELKANFSVGIHWADKPLSNKRTKHELICNIDAQLDRLGRGLQLGSSHELKIFSLTESKKRLVELPDNVELRERRPIQTQPSVNIGLLRTEGISREELRELKAAKTFPANASCPLPFIILSKYKLKKLSKLTDYEPKEANMTVNGKYKCIDAYLNIYEKLN
ncbi:DNA replication terminus site-binding protein (plasmid) [Shewanella xiamenensis]|uniref:DNA replication terminus site-binding protein n=1 Tax=Shewanella xiamenensis TaxID=332186 RepID=A0ABT6UFL2_9GAMM|nr:DNA replication terminus site-binding protein [Shewanella xiamenensis]MDI5833257.1 DNA replication terminus site-binding protein [Shewanella xiamenensis]WHF57992.1 DNA replication terminus site-binding protein [Shewanella xiamenensis]